MDQLSDLLNEKEPLGAIFEWSASLFWNTVTEILSSNEPDIVSLNSQKKVFQTLFTSLDLPYSKRSWSSRGKLNALSIVFSCMNPEYLSEQENRIVTLNFLENHKNANLYDVDAAITYAKGIIDSGVIAPFIVGHVICSIVESIQESNEYKAQDKSNYFEHYQHFARDILKYLTEDDLTPAMTKRIVKQLFFTDGQINDFEHLISEKISEGTNVKKIKKVQYVPSYFNIDNAYENMPAVFKQAILRAIFEIEMELNENFDLHACCANYDRSANVLRKLRNNPGLTILNTVINAAHKIQIVESFARQYSNDSQIEMNQEHKRQIQHTLQKILSDKNFDLYFINKVFESFEGQDRELFLQHLKETPAETINAVPSLHEWVDSAINVSYSSGDTFFDWMTSPGYYALNSALKNGINSYYDECRNQNDHLATRKYTVMILYKNFFAKQEKHPDASGVAGTLKEILDLNDIEQDIIEWLLDYDKIQPSCAGDHLEDFYTSPDLSLPTFSVMAIIFGTDRGSNHLHPYLYDANSLNMTWGPGMSYWRQIKDIGGSHGGVMDCATKLNEQGVNLNPHNIISQGGLHALSFVSFIALWMQITLRPDLFAFYRKVIFSSASVERIGNVADETTLMRNFIYLRAVVNLNWVQSHRGFAAEELQQFIAWILDDFSEMTKNKNYNAPIPNENELNTYETDWEALYQTELNRVNEPRPNEHPIVTQIKEFRMHMDPTIYRNKFSSIIDDRPNETDQDLSALITYVREYDFIEYESLLELCIDLHVWINATYSGLLAQEDLFMPTNEAIDRYKEVDFATAKYLEDVWKRIVHLWNKHIRERGGFAFGCAAGEEVEDILMEETSLAFLLSVVNEDGQVNGDNYFVNTISILIKHHNNILRLMENVLRENNSLIPEIHGLFLTSRNSLLMNQDPLFYDIFRSYYLMKHNETGKLIFAFSEMQDQIINRNLSFVPRISKKGIDLYFRLRQDDDLQDMFDGHEEALISYIESLPENVKVPFEEETLNRLQYTCTVYSQELILQHIEKVKRFEQHATDSMITFSEIADANEINMDGMNELIYDFPINTYGSVLKFFYEKLINYDYLFCNVARQAKAKLKDSARERVYSRYDKWEAEIEEKLDILEEFRDLLDEREDKMTSDYFLGAPMIEFLEILGFDDTDVGKIFDDDDVCGEHFVEVSRMVLRWISDIKKLQSSAEDELVMWTEFDGDYVEAVEQVNERSVKKPWFRNMNTANFNNYGTEDDTDYGEIHTEVIETDDEGNQFFLFPGTETKIYIDGDIKFVNKGGIKYTMSKDAPEMGEFVDEAGNITYYYNVVTEEKYFIDEDGNKQETVGVLEIDAATGDRSTTDEFGIKWFISGPGERYTFVDGMKYHHDKNTGDRVRVQEDGSTMYLTQDNKEYTIKNDIKYYLDPDNGVEYYINNKNDRIMKCEHGAEWIYNFEEGTYYFMDHNSGLLWTYDKKIGHGFRIDEYNLPRYFHSRNEYQFYVDINGYYYFYDAHGAVFYYDQDKY
eukprot:TRINITY_DN3529_c0_g4_i1.p1 TRINITY_DN3529_c0_g4~~TRINITY_DN3529_c0_g4_i1.p1  ORF type:complete len:1580 (+),score=378.25 TRINITY_DN3529_c0_g4_i1:208-4740(+)